VTKLVVIISVVILKMIGKSGAIDVAGARTLSTTFHHGIKPSEYLETENY